jgi:hypothetical protein
MVHEESHEQSTLMKLESVPVENMQFTARLERLMGIPYYGFLIRFFETVQYEGDEYPVELIRVGQRLVDAKIFEKYVLMISTFTFKLSAHLPSNLKCSYASPLEVSLHVKGVFPRARSHVQDVVFGLDVHGTDNALEKIVIEAQCEDDEERIIVSGCKTRGFNVWFVSAPQ